MYNIFPRITPHEIETSTILGTTEVRRSGTRCIVRWLFDFSDFSSVSKCRSQWKVVAGFKFCVQATKLEGGIYLCAARAWEPGMREKSLEFHLKGDRAGPLTLKIRKGAHCEPVWFGKDKLARLHKGTVICKIPVLSEPASSGTVLEGCENAVSLLEAARDMAMPNPLQYCDSFLVEKVDRRSCLVIMADLVHDLQKTEAFQKSLSYFVFFFEEIRESTAWEEMKQQQATACTKILLAAYLKRPNGLAFQLFKEEIFSYLPE